MTDPVVPVVRKIAMSLGEVLGDSVQRVAPHGVDQVDIGPVGDQVFGKRGFTKVRGQEKRSGGCIRGMIACVDIGTERNQGFDRSQVAEETSPVQRCTVGKLKGTAAVRSFSRGDGEHTSEGSESSQGIQHCSPLQQAQWWR
jgi:hypothetical protein